MCEVHRFLHYRDYIVALIKEKKARNPAYSLRAYARDIDVAASLLSKIINGIDSVTTKTAEYLAVKMKLDDREKEYFIELVKAHRSDDYSVIHKMREIEEFRSVKLNVEEAYQVPFDDFSIFLKVSLHKKVEATLEWAQRLRRDPEDLWQTCERLVAAGYIEGDRDSGWTTNITHVLSDDKQMAANREYHRQYMMRQVDAFRMPPTERVFYSTLRTVSPEDYDVFCETLRDYLNNVRVSDALESPDDKIYLLGIQLFPFEDDISRLPVGTTVSRRRRKK